MAKEQHHLLSSYWISLWLLLFLCSYFFIQKLNVGVSYRTVGIRDDSSPGDAIEIASKNDSTNFEMGKYPFLRALKTEENKTDPCGGRYIYVHDLPPKFNEAILKECEIMIPWMNMCKYFKNNGFGPEIENPEGVFSDGGWYETNQFTLEVIFKNRMEQYDCLTRDSSIAAAIYVPFYAGFDVCRHLFNYSTQVRDALSYELIDWLRKTPEWKVMGGKDHFVVAGRVTWAFRRHSENMSDWGDKFLLLAEIKNMSTLLIESSPFHSNDFAIPYPTYFHPSNDAQVLFWQDRVRKLNRNWLFTFAGATRPNDPRSIRSDIMDQCKHSKRCNHLECAGKDKSCDSPRRIIMGFEQSIFCLQPTGDSSTRRSTFDSILAGCIPVFFHPAAAYTQYTWHLPNNYSKYSVFISEDEIRNKSVSIEEILKQISPQQIEEMRAEVIKLIPKIVYAADPRSKSRTFKDAFDIAVEAVIRRVTNLRRDIVKGRIRENLHEELSWKYSLFEEKDDGQTVLERPHEWDTFFKFG